MGLRLFLFEVGLSCGIFLTISAQTARANDLEEFNLESLQVIDDTFGLEIRGASSYAGSGRVGEITALLFDPRTNSSVVLFSDNSLAGRDLDPVGPEQLSLKNVFSQGLYNWSFGSGFAITRLR